MAASHYKAKYIYAKHIAPRVLKSSRRLPTRLVSHHCTITKEAWTYEQYLGHSNHHTRSLVSLIILHILGTRMMYIRLCKNHTGFMWRYMPTIILVLISYRMRRISVAMHFLCRCVSYSKRILPMNTFRSHVGERGYMGQNIRNTVVEKPLPQG